VVDKHFRFRRRLARLELPSCGSEHVYHRVLVEIVEPALRAAGLYIVTSRRERVAHNQIGRRYVTALQKRWYIMNILHQFHCGDDIYRMLGKMSLIEIENLS